MNPVQAALVYLLNDARKAGAAGLIGFLTPLGVLLAATDQPLTLRSLAASVVAGAIAYGGVWATSNRVTSPDVD